MAKPYALVGCRVRLGLNCGPSRGFLQGHRFSHDHLTLIWGVLQWNSPELAIPTVSLGYQIRRGTSHLRTSSRSFPDASHSPRIPVEIPDSFVGKELVQSSNSRRETNRIEPKTKGWFGIPSRPTGRHGLWTNRFPTLLPRAYIRQLGGPLHAWKKIWSDAAARNSSGTND